MVCGRNASRKQHTELRLSTAEAQTCLTVKWEATVEVHREKCGGKKKARD